MSKFNMQTKNQTETVNLAGGKAYKESSKLELVSILLTSFVEDKFYEKAATNIERIATLLGEVDPAFAAKVALYARNVFGMRSVTHVVAAIIGNKVKGESWTKRFFNKIVHRPDDMMEILSFYIKVFGKPIPSALKKGFATAIGRFDSYSLGKYRAKTKEVSLVDVVNLVHPIPNKRNEEALALLIKGDLRSKDTWESMLTKAGQEAETDEEKEALKKDAWADLILNKKLGYFALLRNLRNIALHSPGVLQQALETLVDENLIRKSMVLPFRFYTAYETISNDVLLTTHTLEKRAILAAIDKAATISLGNLPKLNGDTLIAVDNSHSMNGRPINIASMFAAAIYKQSNADVIVFSNTAKYATLNPNDGVISIANNIKNACNPAGTNFQAIFSTANRKYDRIIILSDMQAWINTSRYRNDSRPTENLEKYRRRYLADPKIWSFDLAGYGTLQFPERNVYALAGFSEKIFGIMEVIEADKENLINTIESVEL